MSEEICSYSADAKNLIAELVAMNELYNELLMAIGSKYEGETRHETALRYIREREGNVGLCCGARTRRRRRGMNDSYFWLAVWLQSLFESGRLRRESDIISCYVEDVEKMKDIQRGKDVSRWLYK